MFGSWRGFANLTFGIRLRFWSVINRIRGASNRIERRKDEREARAGEYPAHAPGGERATWLT